MQISENFTLEEMCKSAYAKHCGIDNTPGPIEKANIYRLVLEVLQPIRDEFGEPIIVNSCFRNKQVNDGIGGAKNSDHLYGAAADIRTQSNKLPDNMRLWKCIIKMMEEGKIDCRQIIFEYGRKTIGPQWIPLSINHNKNKYKDNEVLYIIK